MTETRFEVNEHGEFIYVVQDKHHITKYLMLGFKEDGSYNIKFIKREDL